MGKFRSTIPEKRVEWGQSGRVLNMETKTKGVVDDLSASQFIERGLFTRSPAGSLNQTAVAQSSSLRRRIIEGDIRGYEGREGDKGGTAGSSLTSVPKKPACLSRRIGEQVCERDKFICVCLAC